MTILTALLFAVSTAPAVADIRVTPAGVAPLRFDTAPASGDWSTLSVGGAAGTYTSTAALDTAVSNLNAANITTALAATASWPPTGSTLARWNNGTAVGAQRCLQTRANGNAYLVLMARLLNATGANVSSITVSYAWGQWNNRPVNESIAGQRAFYSLTGAPGSWQLIPGFSVFDNNSPNQTLSATVNVGTWPPGTTLYLLWIDDNGPGVDTNPKQGAYTLDDFTVSNVLPAITASYLDNGVVKIGADLGKGGAITYLSPSGTTNNVINNYDLGRQIQQSYYSGPQPYDPAGNLHPGWPNWPWNPIQTGDVYYNPSAVLAHTNDGQTLYIKCRPKQWALNNVDGECTFESWITLNGKVVTVKNRLLNFRTDTAQQFAGRDQELPAVYTNGDLFRLVSYNGNAPFTGGATTVFPTTPPPWLYWRATESWAALLNTSNWGLGVYHPGAVYFVGGFAGAPGSGGTYDDPTGYISPLHKEVIDSNIEHTYTYQLILGTLIEIRNHVYEQTYRPACDFVFDTDRKHWRFEQTTDSGWPFVNQRLRVNLNSGDPQMWSPNTAFAAAAVPKLYIRAAFQIANPAGRANGQVFWEKNSTNGLSQAQSIIFPVTADGQYHTYELDLAATGQWSGLITQMRFDPAFNGEPGDYMDIKAISSNPFAGNEQIAPTLDIARTNGDIVVSFPTITAATAGFISKNLRYDLQSSADLAPGNWQPVAGATNLLGDGSTRTFNYPLSSGPTKFFRLKVRLE
jgi:hypothetical protein